MARFRYKALGAGGETLEGVVDALDERAAATLLRDRALFVLDLRAGGGLEAKASTDPDGARRIPPMHQSFFFRQLALMTRSGVTLLQALATVERQASHKATSAVAARLGERIRSGASLSKAMADAPRAFPPLAVRLVASAEATGELDPVLDRIADVVERRALLQRTILTSLAYPAIVFVVALGVAVFLVVGVVPKFAQFFARRDIAMPWTTQLLMDLSVWVRTWGPHVILAVGVFLAVAIALYLTPRGRLAFDRFFLSVPLVGAVLRSAAFSQLGWTLGALLRSGVGLLDALKLTARGLKNRALGTHLEGVTDKVLAGSSLSKGVEDPLVPPIVPSLLSAGERSGALTEVLGGLSDFYQQDLELRIKRMSSLVEPVLILVVGGMVAFVYLAFFQALIQLSSR